MLTGLKVSYWHVNWRVFYRQAFIAKGEGETTGNWVLKVLKWNLSTNRTRLVDEKNGDICLVIIFMVFKVSVITNVLAMKDLKDLIELLQKMAWLIGFELNCSWDNVGLIFMLYSAEST